jgi:hypothetical protein
LNKTESYALGHVTGIEASRDYPDLDTGRLRVYAEQVYNATNRRVGGIDHDQFVKGFIRGYQGKKR